MTKPSYTETRRSADPPPELIRVVNRIALLTFFTAFATVLGLVLVPRTFADGPLLLRVAATLPLLVAAGTVLHVRRLRAELRGLRQAAGTSVEPPLAPRSNEPVQRAPRSARAPDPTVRDAGMER